MGRERHVSGQSSAATELLSAVVLAAAAALLPRLTSTSIAVDIVIFAIAATGFNLLLGYTGLLSFAQGAFFGLGGYVAGNLLLRSDLHLFVILLAAVVLSALAAGVLGFFSVRIKGVYFVLMTLAFGQMAYFLALTWRSLTGGPSGLRGFSRPDLWLGGAQISLQNTTAFYWFCVAMFVVCFYAFRKLIDSPVGLIFRAAKENEDRLDAIGWPANRFKVLSFCIAGGMTGLAGALYALQWQIVPISVVHMNQSASIAFMSILGGTGHPWGPVIGAVVYTWLSDVFSTYWARWPIIFGLLIIMVAFFLRGGLMEGWTIIRRGLQRVFAGR